MRDLLVNMIIGDIQNYEEKLEEFKARKQEISKDVKKLERLKKLVDKAKVDGVELNIPEGSDNIHELAFIDESIKIIKAILRRFDTVCEMYGIEYNEHFEDEVATDQE